jgi:hypothetical protein
MNVDDIEIDILDDHGDDGAEPGDDGAPNRKRRKFHDQTQDTVDQDLVEKGAEPGPPILYFPLTKPQRKAACKRMEIAYFAASGPNPKNCGAGKCLTAPVRRPIVYVDSEPDGHCYFHTISYLLCGQQYFHNTIRTKVCEYIENPANLPMLQTYFPEFKSGKEYVVAKRMRGGGWGTEVEMFVVAQMLAHDVVSFTRYGKWERYVGSGNSKDVTRTCLYINNESGNHFDPVTKI